MAYRNIDASQRSNTTPGHANAAISSCHARTMPGMPQLAGPRSASPGSSCPAVQQPRRVGWETCSLCNLEVPKCREQEPGRQGAGHSATVARVLCQARVATVPQEPAKGYCLGSRQACGSGTPHGGENGTAWLHPLWARSSPSWQGLHGPVML